MNYYLIFETDGEKIVWAELVTGFSYKKDKKGKHSILSASGVPAVYKGDSVQVLPFDPEKHAGVTTNPTQFAFVGGDIVSRPYVEEAVELRP